MISFRIDIEPQGKVRPRTSHKDGVFRVHTSPKTIAYERAIAAAAKDAMGGRSMLEGPIHVHVTAFMTPPKKIPADRMGRPTTKPDADNVLKAIADACNGILWKDDAQIVEATVLKQYSSSPALVIVARAA